MMFGIERKVERAARKGAALSAAGLLAMVGLAFLTTAGWMVLTELRSPLFAASIIGAVYVGLAAIVLAIGLKKPDHSHHKSQPKSAQGVDTSDLTPLQLVVLSFIQGFEQGRQNSRSD
jgi:hypothetical protein